jgi:hypothetical protein
MQLMGPVYLGMKVDITKYLYEIRSDKVMIPTFGQFADCLVLDNGGRACKVTGGFESLSER